MIQVVFKSGGYGGPVPLKRGAEVKKSFACRPMRKFISLLSLFSISLALCSCDGGGRYEDSFYVRAWEESILDGNRSLQRKEYAQAIIDLERGVAEARSMSHPDLRLAIALDELGAAYYAVDDLDRAKTSLQEALRLYEKLKPPTPEIGSVVEDGKAKSRCVLGQISFRNGDVAEANENFQDALSIYDQLESRLGPTALRQREIMKLSVELADVNFQQRNFAPAEALYARALSLLPACVGVRPYERRLQTNYRKLLVLQNKSVKELDATLSPLDATVEAALKWDLKNARGYIINSDYDKAEELCLDALQRSEMLGEVNPELIRTLAELSTVYVFKGSLEKATACLNRAMILQKRIIGPQDLRMHKLMKAAVELEVASKNYPAALETLGRQWEIDLNLPADKSTVLAKLQNRATTAFVLHKLGRESECDRAISEAKELLAQTKRSVIPLFELGSIYVDRGNFREAELMYERLMKNARRRQDQLPGRLAKALAAMANLYSREGKYAEAEPLYREAIEIMRKSPAMMRTSDYVQLVRNSSAVFSKLPGHEEEASRLLAEVRGKDVLAGIENAEDPDDFTSAETRAQRRERRRAARIDFEEIQPSQARE